MDRRDRRARRASASSPRSCRRSSCCPRSGSCTCSPGRRSSRAGSATCVALGLATIAAGGWWVAIVQLWPASSRPYIGGSQNNSFWNVLFGYNGFGRLTGNESGSVGGGAQAADGPLGPDRLARACSTRSSAVRSRGCSRPRCSCSSPGSRSPRRAPRTDRTRAALGLWGGWLVVTGARVLARPGHHPPVLLGRARARDRRARRHRRDDVLGAPRSTRSCACCSASSIAVTAVWAYVLLEPHARRGSRCCAASCWSAGSCVAVVVAIAPALRGRVGVALAIAAVAIGLAAPAAYTLSTVAHTAQRRDPDRRARERGAAVPAAAGRGGARRLRAFGGATRRRIRGRRIPAGRRRRLRRRWLRRLARRRAAARPAAPRAAAPAAAGVGGLLNGSTPSAAITALFEAEHRATAGPRRRSARTTRPATSSRRARRSWRSAASTAPTRPRRSPSSSSTCRPARSTTSSRRRRRRRRPGRRRLGEHVERRSRQWVEQHFTAQTVGGTTIYDLSSSVASGEPTGREARGRTGDRRTGTLLPWPTRRGSQSRRCRTCRPSTRPRCA